MGGYIPNLPQNQNIDLTDSRVAGESGEVVLQGEQVVRVVV